MHVVCLFFIHIIIFFKIRDKVYDTDDELPLYMTVDKLQFMTDNITEDTTVTLQEPTVRN